MMDMNRSISNPTESEEQQRIFEWAWWSRGRYPELELLHSIPNGGARCKATAGRLKAEGVKAGVPDMFLPVPRAQKHGLYIELKKKKGGRLSDEQKKWIAALAAKGYTAIVCHGADEAIKAITGYLSQPLFERMDDKPFERLRDELSRKEE